MRKFNKIPKEMARIMVASKIKTTFPNTRRFDDEQCFIVRSRYEDKALQLGGDILVVITKQPKELRRRGFHPENLYMWLAVEDGSYCFCSVLKNYEELQYGWIIKEKLKRRRVLIEKSGCY